MNIELIPDEVILNVLEFINILDLRNLSLVSKKINYNINYFFKKKIKIIKNFLINLEKENQIFFLENCSNYYLFNLIAHLNNYSSLSLKDIKISKNSFKQGDYVIKIIKNISKISINYNNNNNNKKIELWFTNSYNNNLLGPALLRWYENGEKECFIWYRNNYIHNDKGPASIKWYKNGIIEQKSFYVNGKHQNFNNEEPNLIRWYKNGNKSFESYNKINTEFPELIRWYENGNKKLEHYSYKIENKPNLIKWHMNGLKSQESYYNKFGIVKRLKRWDDNGLLIIDKFL